MHDFVNEYVHELSARFMSKDSHEVTESTTVRLCEWRAELLTVQICGATLAPAFLKLMLYKHYNRMKNREKHK